MTFLSTKSITRGFSRFIHPDFLFMRPDDVTSRMCVQVVVLLSSTDAVRESSHSRDDAGVRSNAPPVALRIDAKEPSRSLRVGERQDAAREAHARPQALPSVTMTTTNFTLVLSSLL